MPKDLFAKCWFATYLQLFESQGHSEGLYKYSQDATVSALSSELLILLQPNIFYGIGTSSCL